MRYADINEVAVLSSWIEDLEWNEEEGGVIMALNSGREYLVRDVPEMIFQEWINAPSKGKFWHSDIRGLYHVTRIL